MRISQISIWSNKRDGTQAKSVQKWTGNCINWIRLNEFEATKPTAEELFCFRNWNEQHEERKKLSTRQQINCCKVPARYPSFSLPFYSTIARAASSKRLHFTSTSLWVVYEIVAKCTSTPSITTNFPAHTACALPDSFFVAFTLCWGFSMSISLVAVMRSDKRQV